MVNELCNVKIDFASYMKYFCTKSCLLQLLQYYGVPHALLYINIGFKLEIVFSGESFSVNGTDVLEPAASKNILESGKSDSFADVLKINRQQLSNFSYPIVLVDTYYLPYRREYKKVHASHAVILAKIEKDSVYIIDYYPPHYFRGYVELTLFQKSRCSLNPKDINPFSGIPIRNFWYNILPCDISQYLNECILNNLQDIICQKSSFEKGIMREEALAYLYSYFILHKNKEQDIKRVVVQKIHDALFVYYNASNLLKYYFEELEKIIEIPDIVMKDLQEFNDCMAQFNILCMRGMMSEKQVIFEHIENKFVEVIKKQRIFMKNVETWILHMQKNDWKGK